MSTVYEPEVITPAGLNPTFTAPPDNTQELQNYSGEALLIIRHTGGTNANFTVQTTRAQVANDALELQSAGTHVAGTERIYGPFPTFFNNASQQTRFNTSQFGSLEIAAVVLQV